MVSLVTQAIFIGHVLAAPGLYYIPLISRQNPGLPEGRMSRGWTRALFPEAPGSDSMEFTQYIWNQ